LTITELSWFVRLKIPSFNEEREAIGRLLLIATIPAFPNELLPPIRELSTTVTSTLLRASA
jgi:hypothetical protein